MKKSRLKDSAVEFPRQVRLKPRRERSVRRRHPWVFSGAIAEVRGRPSPGETVAVCDAHGEFLAWGQYSPHSQIRVRLVSWRRADAVDAPDFWRARIRRAVAARAPLRAEGHTTAFRLVHAESDALPGLIADLYGETLVVQFLTQGAELRRELLVSLLAEEVRPQAVYERSDADVRRKEGLAARSGLLQGSLPQPLIVVENGLRFAVDVRQGHKTGFYLDQRENRALLRRFVTRRARMGEPPDLLNVFAYTGGFTLAALAGGATSAINVDTSAEALRRGRENLSRNGFDGAQVEDRVGDAFQLLRQMRRQERRFDLIVLDPPKFAFTRRDVQRAARGYKDINLQAFHLLRPGGLLFTFSCSGLISPDLFQKIVFGAALDAGREARIIAPLAQGPDHPIALTFPEGAYLKGLVCRVD